jgi:hypothetical protein
MLRVGILDYSVTCAENIKSPSTSGGDAAEDRVIKLNRVIPLPPNKGKPVKEAHVVAMDTWEWEER